MAKRGIGRREFVAGAAGVGAAGLMGASPLAASAPSQAQGGRAGSAPESPRRDPGLPVRGELLIRGAHVLTMDPALGDIPNGDVHVKSGNIVAVGKNLAAPGAAVIDARHTIAMPGFVDTHWHMWTTYLRCMAGDKPDDGYFPVTTRYGMAMQPDDMYHSTKLAAAEAIYSGITTVNDECHNIRSLDYALADLRALRETGLRARFSYGPYRGIPPDEPRDLAGLEKLHSGWSQHSSDGLIALGYTWGGLPTADASGTAPPQSRVDAARKEIETARRLGVPISIHLASRDGTPAGQVQAQAEFLGSDMLLIHMLATSPEEMKLVARSGAWVSTSPGSELRIGYGLTKVSEFREAGVKVAVSVDTAPLTGNCHMFGILKLMRNAVNAKALDEFKLNAREALEMGTIQGARALGIDRMTGSLTLGKRADLILVRTDAITMGVFTDPAHMIVEAAEPSNVDTVVIDGRILKRNGKLTSLSSEQIIADAAATLAAVTKRVKTPSA